MLRQGTSHLVLATGTDIGKTFLIENICRNFLQKNLPVSAIKPISSGFKDDCSDSDSAKILASLGQKFSVENLDEISPWRFEQAISPHLAAEISGKKIDFFAVKKFCLTKINQAKQLGSCLLIEGAGGVMTPISNDKNFCDLAEELRISTLLVTSNYLGSISHTLCAVAALRAKKIHVEAIVVNEFSAEKKSSITPEQLISTLQGFTNFPVIAMSNFLRTCPESFSSPDSGMF